MAMGTGATRVEERIAASRGELQQTPIMFENCQSLEHAGVLLMLPALLAQGLMDYKSHYQDIKGVYYDLDITILFLSFMYLCRIPEARCLRAWLKQIIQQKKSEQWGMAQANMWVKAEGTTIYYVDGHPKVYCGDQANLGKKHISRLKLCMPAIMEFWVNNHQGMPYFVVTGEVNEKPGEMLTGQIIPRLKQQVALPVSEQDLLNDPGLPRFTLTFDREGYSPKAFKSYWENDRIAVLTYNKNVKDKWPESEFHQYTIPVDGNEVKMELAQREIQLEGMKIREKISRRQAQLFLLNEENVNSALETAPQYLKKQTKHISQINQLKAEEQDLPETRKKQPYKIEVKNMPENTRYTKLDMEGKLFQNLIKMICYRAETTVAALLDNEVYKKQEEIRSLVKSIIKSRGDMCPDYKQKTLTIKLYTLSNPRDNRALEKLCELLTDSETAYPGTELRLIYKLATN